MDTVKKHDTCSNRRPRRRYRAPFIASILILVSGLPTEAERSPSFFEETIELPTEPSLKDYIAYGTHRNARLQATYLEYSAASQRIIQAKALPDPVMRITHFIEAIQTRTGPQENQFSLSQTIPLFGKLHTRVSIANEEAESFWWRFAEEKLQLIRQIETLYYEYAYLGKAITINRKSLELLQTIEPIVEERLRTGGDLNSLLRLQVEIGRTDDALRLLEKDGPVLKVEFNVLLNRDMEALLPWPKMAEDISNTALPYTNWVKVRERNPKLVNLRHRREAGDFGAKLARLQRFPDLTVGLNYLQTGSSFIPGTRNSGEDPLGFTFAFNLPLWRGKYRAAELEARNSSDATASLLQDTENQLYADYKDIVESLTDNARRISLYGQDLLPKAHQAMELTGADYRSGRATLLEYIDSQRSLLDLELIYWRVMVDYRVNYARLKALYTED